jgi:uncharacterized membrane protein YgdD (TMEM256/DUF423 family)
VTLFWIRIASVVMFLGVAIGAFGAHGLKNVLDEPMKAVYQTGVHYHLLHGLALFVVAWISTKTDYALVTAAGWLFLAGIFLFSGSLYALSLSGLRWLGAITPLGGLAFLAGWICLALTRF